MSDTFTVGGRRGGAKQKDLYLEGYGKAWSEKLTFTVGTSYAFAAFIGILKGIQSVKQIQKETVTQKHLYRYNLWNTIGRTTTRYGNACASAALMFCLFGKAVDLVFEEEVKEFGMLPRNIFVGGLTGLVYKSHLGWRPALFSCGLGSLLIVSLTFGINFMHDRGVIGFKMEM